MADKNTPSIPEDLMTAEEAAALLHVKKGTIHNWAAARRVPHYKVGSRSLFSKAELLALVVRVEAL